MRTAVRHGVSHRTNRGNPFSHAPPEISENLAEFSFFLISFPRGILSSDGTQVAASIVRQRR
jgi:hypothetical protein